DLRYTPAGVPDTETSYRAGKSPRTSKVPSSPALAETAVPRPSRSENTTGGPVAVADAGPGGAVMITAVVLPDGAAARTGTALGTATSPDIINDFRSPPSILMVPVISNARRKSRTTPSTSALPTFTSARAT